MSANLLYHYLHSLCPAQQGALRRVVAPRDWDVVDLIIAARLVGQETFALRRSDVLVVGPISVDLDPPYRFFRPDVRAFSALGRLLCSPSSSDYLVAHGRCATDNRDEARRQWEGRVVRPALRAASLEPEARWYRRPAPPSETKLLGARFINP